jgi:hypothetical protein
LNPGLAHFAVEVAIDLLLLKNDDPDLGNKLFGAALSRSQEDMILLSLVFSEHVQTLNEGEFIFRDLVFSYATALIVPDEFLRMQALGTLGAEIAAGMGVTIDSTTVQEILTKAIFLCEQPDAYYMNIITEAINGISKEKTHPGHKKSGL